MRIKEEKFLIDSSSLFEFQHPACECDLDENHPSRGVKEYTFRIYPKQDEYVRFAYKGASGLIKLKDSGAIDGKPVLSELLAVQNEKPKALKEFIEKFGFLLPLVAIDGNSAKAEVLFSIINRVKMTVGLMSELGEPQKDYDKILGLTLALSFEEPVALELAHYTNPFETCCHELFSIWNNVHPPSVVDFNDPSSSVFPIGSMSIKNSLGIEESSPCIFIPDTVRPPETALDKEEIDAREFERHNGTQRSKSEEFFDNVFYLFMNAHNVSPNCRLALDFLFHYCREVRGVESWDNTGRLTAIKKRSFAASESEDKLDDTLKDALIRFAKNTLKDEIEFNLMGVTPCYDVDTMTPSWEVDHLLTALYFSIFYMRPNLELYRLCANPNCGRYFLVKTTTAKQKYCETSCANAMAQRNHRLKAKAAKNSEK